MRKSGRFGRIVLSLLLLACFGVLAIYLYQKQQLKINYLSFKIENAEHSFVVPDVDRLVNKISTAEELEMPSMPTDLKTAFNVLIANRQFSVNRELTKEIFISFNADAYVVVFNTSSSIGALLDAVNDGLEQTIEYEKGTLKVGGQSLFVEHFGQYLAVSNEAISPVEREDIIQFGNADYVEFEQITERQTRHILSKKLHFRVWDQDAKEIKGRAVNHNLYFYNAPFEVDELVFYGSSRFSEDYSSFFEGAHPQSFDWASQGILYLRKGDFEFVMGEQGEGRDLSLMLEEYTLDAQDTSEIAYFNIGKFKIMPFENPYQWSSSVAELDTELEYYTEYNNFNLMANSIPALRWFIGEVQLGKIIENNEIVLKTYNDCLSENAHEIRMSKDSVGGYFCESIIYDRDSTRLVSQVSTFSQELSLEGIQIVYDFNVEIVPDNLQYVSISSDSVILLNDKQKVAAYQMNGTKKWLLNLSTPLIDRPQIADFENDGKYELVLFQKDQIDVVNDQGKSISGFPVKLNAQCNAGLAVNYDNAYKWRLLVNVGNTVKVYSETGKLVEGWMFKGMNAEIDSKIYHVITEGKDIITFKDASSFQHVLNRRGEYRLNHDIVFKLENETDFVVGSLESALRKMGYKDGYIYNYYILDGYQDSLAIDKPVAPIRTYWEYNGGKPLLILEETDRLIIVNQFGYVQSEVLKPNQSNQFVGLIGNQDYGFVFADNSQNSIYLLNNFGKMMLPQAVNGSKVSIIESDLLITFSGVTVKAYKIAAQ